MYSGATKGLHFCTVMATGRLASDPPSTPRGWGQRMRIIASIKDEPEILKNHRAVPVPSGTGDIEGQVGWFREQANWSISSSYP